MSEILDIKSKKGMSLAYVLVVCLFLMMITGGIVSVALLQHNETGSDLNVRQAYISAKSGLDTMQDSLKNKVIAASDLPITDEGEMYYVMYVNSSDPNGEIHYEYRTTEEAIKLLLETIESDNTKTIVGGEGTYFKIKKTSNVDYKVTALNTTGKYNNNTTLNQGDLSVSVAVYKSYTFGNPQPDPTEAPSYYVPDGGGGNDFLMVGQQTAVNELRSGGASAYKTLNNMYKIGSGGSGSGTGTQVMYVLDTQANSDVSTSYAPLVYDKTVRLTSQKEHSQVAAYNEGIYLLGGATGDEINDYAFEDGKRKNLGQTSFFTQNSDYSPEFRCKFMVISHNFNTVDHSPVLSYYGEGSRSFVYVYLENDIIFNMCRSAGKTYDYAASFTKKRGWYRFDNGYMFDPNRWHACSEPDESSLGCKNHLPRIKSILDSGGQLHSGGRETERDDGGPMIRILSNDGLYEGSGSTPSGTENAYIYCSPCKAPYSSGKYTWNAKEFSLYWTGTDSFKLTNGAKIFGTGGVFVITTLRNNMIEQGGSSEEFNIQSNRICVMGNLVVKYGTKTYDIKAGTYNLYAVKEDGKVAGVDPNSFQKKIADANGINLFSDLAQEFFAFCYEDHSTPVLTPHTGDVIDPETGAITLDQSDFESVSGVRVIPKTAPGQIFYKQPNDEKTYNVIQVSGPYTIKRELADGSLVDLIKFEDAGKYKIPITVGSKEAEVGVLLDGALLKERAGWVESNYDCLSEEEKTHMSDKGYY